MSTAGAATLAVAREAATKDDEYVTKSDTGTAMDDSPAKWTDILAKLVPTGMIAGYSLLITMIVGFIDEPTVKDPNPNEYIPGRIVLWVLFILITLAYSYSAYLSRRPKSRKKKRKVQWELVASTFAFAAWGVSTPGSWLIDTFDSNVNRVVMPTAIGVVSVLLLGLFSGSIKMKLPK
jgi:uncharacterized membrane protein